MYPYTGGLGLGQYTGWCLPSVVGRVLVRVLPLCWLYPSLVAATTARTAMKTKSIFISYNSLFANGVLNYRGVA